jgi:predicted GH43/DUF377 family glycosyl hydrolase
MQGIKRSVSFLLVLIIALSVFSVFEPASSAQAAEVWQKQPADSVLDVNLASEPCVILDNSVYKMWYTQNTSDFSGFDTLISDLIAHSPDFINHFQSRDIPVDDYAQIKEIVEHLLELSQSDIGNLLKTDHSIIGYVTSNDGKSWEDSTNCVISGSGPGATYGVGAPTVLKSNDGYQMWYTGWDPDPAAIETFLSNLKTTYDSLSGEETNTLANDLFIQKDIALFLGHIKSYIANFDDFEDTLLADMDRVLNKGMKQIGYATSSDGINWTSVPCVFSGDPTTWDKYGRFSPSVVKNGATYEMWYSGFNLDYTVLLDLLGTNPDMNDINNTLAEAIQLSIGKATSTDGGITWVKTTTDSAVFKASATTGAISGAISPSILKVGTNSYKMWYTNINLPISSALDYLQGSGTLDTFTSASNMSIYKAESTDGGVTWTGASPLLTRGTGTSWDSLGVGSPSVIPNDSNFVLWYTGFSGPAGTLANSLLDGDGLSSAIADSDAQIRIGRVYSQSSGSGSGGGSSGGGGGGGGVKYTPVNINNCISPVPLRVDSQGIVESAVTLTSPDGKVINIAAGTKLLDFSGKPLSSLDIQPVTPLPAVPNGDTVVMAFNLSPEGANFVPALNITVNYEPSILPAGAAEKDLYIAWWDGTKWWQKMATVVNTETHTISFQLDHFSQYAVVGKISNTLLPSSTPTTTVKPTAIPVTTPSTKPSTTSAVTAHPVTKTSTPISQIPQETGISNWIIVLLAAVFVIVVIVTVFIVMRLRNSIG